MSIYNRLKEKNSDDPLKKVEDYISDIAGKSFSCDYIFGLFALYTARYSTAIFFKELVLFLSLYRIAINAEGWTK